MAVECGKAYQHDKARKYSRAKREGASALELDAIKSASLDTCTVCGLCEEHCVGHSLRVPQTYGGKASCDMVYTYDKHGKQVPLGRVSTKVFTFD